MLAARGGDDQRPRRRAQGGVGAVDLVRGGAAQLEAEVADDLVRPMPSKMNAARGSSLSGVRPVPAPWPAALGGESDSDQRLRGPAAIDPVATRLARRMMTLAGPAGPGSDPLRPRRTSSTCGASSATVVTQ